MRLLRVVLPLVALILSALTPVVAGKALAAPVYYYVPPDTLRSAPAIERRAVAPRMQVRQKQRARHAAERQRRLREQHFAARPAVMRRAAVRSGKGSNEARRKARVVAGAPNPVLVEASVPRFAPEYRPQIPRLERAGARQVASLGDTARQSRLAVEPVRQVEARIDIASQRMVVKVDGEVRHVWKVSTGRRGYATPRGAFKPQRLHARYFSRKYYNSPMPYSIFFRGGYAIHGTTATDRLGGPASHGCVRLATANARTLFQLVRAAGSGRTRIIIT